MRIAPPSFHSVQSPTATRNSSMSQDFDRNIYSFSNGFERSEHQQQQIRRDKLRTQILEAPPPPLVGMEEDGIQSYIFSDMFNYASGGAAAATELLEPQPYRNPREADWFSHSQGAAAAADGGFEDSKNQTVVNDTATYNRHQISSINHDSAAAMQLFLMNQQQQRRSASPSPPPASAGLHMSSSYHAADAGGAFGQFTWAPNNPNEILQGQGLSLSLLPSEELRLGLLFGQTAPPQYGGGTSQSRHLHVGFSGLSNSKYTKAAKELLHEFCNVGRSHFKKPKANKNPTGGGAAGGDSPSSSKDLPPLSASERVEHQRRKVKLSSMLDELDRRYNHYCERMQMVVNTFDMIMGYGAAAPYTMLAKKAMSRHFRCLREAISDQMRLSSEQLGEKDGAKSGLTKGETPRLKFLEQRLRQQRAFHQMGGAAAEQEAWRPQRGLPQRSLTILRAWLFEHFLHPYPSDADKHLLARQTGLSKNQVANWFINARVRLWKPMVEEMYLQEAKDQSEDQTATAQIPTPTTAAAAAVTPPPPASKINAHENDPSLLSFNTSENHPSPSNHVSPPTSTTAAPPANEVEACRKLPDGAGIESAMIRFGASSGDVSLTLGLRHDGNLPEKSYFSVRDFGSY